MASKQKNPTNNYKFKWPASRKQHRDEYSTFDHIIWEIVGGRNWDKNEFEDDFPEFFATLQQNLKKSLAS